MSDIRVVNMSAHKSPEFEPFSQKGKEWVLNGVDNCNYQYVINRYKYSPTNATIIDSYSNYIYGKGLTAKYTAENANQFAEVLKLISKKELKKVVKDFALFHEASLEIILAKSGNKIVEVNHLPKNKVVPNKVNDKGEIENYWYSYDWSDIRKYPPQPIPVFKKDTTQKRTVFIIKEYNVDEFYFARPSYFSGLNYAELEEEIAIYCVNHIKNGLSAGHIINFNDGEADQEVKDAIERNINKKLAGSSNAGKRILSFNSNKENATTVEAIEISDAHQQYQFLSEEARRQLLIAHKVISPKMFGIDTSTGFSSNADEIITAFDETMLNVIQPLQEPILDGLMELLSHNGISLELEFIPLRPKVIAQPTTQLKKQYKFNEVSVAEGLIALGEEENLIDWELVAECEVDYANEYTFASTGSAFPNAKSEQDSADYMVRYQYAPLKVSENSREFCRKMVNAGKIYRKEDIIRMENEVVNAGWGANGADKYSIWLYKGGGDCHHKWFRKIYVKKGVKVDVNSPLAELISTTKARQEGFNPPANNDLVAIAPKDMKNNGFLEPR
jgi:hypothetical protein